MSLIFRITSVHQWLYASIAKLVAVNCEYCQNLLCTSDAVPLIEVYELNTSFLQDVSRGNLKSPSAHLFASICTAYKCFSVLKSLNGLFRR